MCWKEESFLIIERKELRHAVPLVLSARLRSSLIGSNKARVTTAILHHSSLLYETPVTSQKPTFHVRWAAALTASPPEQRQEPWERKDWEEKNIRQKTSHLTGQRKLWNYLMTDNMKQITHFPHPSSTLITGSWSLYKHNVEPCVINFERNPAS